MNLRNLWFRVKCYSYCVPYREVPQAAVAHEANDPSSVSRVIELRDQFGRMDEAKLWPPPADAPFVAHNTNVLAVSGDGKRALVCAAKHAWLIDTVTMVATPAISLPGEAKIAVLSGDGSVALFIADSTLYRWDVDAATPNFQQVWQCDALSSVDVLRVTPDARVAIAAYRNSLTTIRVFDLDAMTMTYSLRADAYRGILLHPGGRHIVCFADNRRARFYGKGGAFHTLQRCTGGAFSRDGTLLLVNDLDDSECVTRYQLSVEDETMTIGMSLPFPVRRKLDGYKWQASFSPSGESALLQCERRGGAMLNFDAEAITSVEAEIEWSTALLADESSVLSPSASAKPFDVHATGIGLWHGDSREVAGILLATRGEPPVLAVITPLGLYGSMESEAGPTSEKLALPYERPGLISKLLSGSGHELERGERLRLDEVSARREAWQPFRSKMTVDIGDRDLMAINRALVELTPEIVHRASGKSKTSTNFGTPQLSLLALQEAADELRALPLVERQSAFESMVRRMRRPHRDAQAAQPQRAETEPSPASLPPGATARPVSTPLASATVGEESEVQALAVTGDNALASQSGRRWVGLGAVGAALSGGIIYLLSQFI